MPRGVYPRPTLAERFWKSVDEDGPVPERRPDLGPCWLWRLSHDENGYGYTSENGITKYAHVVAWDLTFGPPGEGLERDHLCRNPGCCNPWHLEAVTSLENTLRGIGPSAENARKTHCDNGHEFTPENTITGIRRGRPFRKCRQCNRDGDNRRRAAKRREMVGNGAR